MQITLSGVPVHLGGAGLPSVYVLEQMHFHWSAEHTVDGYRHPLELHFVHYDVEYANFSAAAEHEYGVVVVAVLFEVRIALTFTQHIRTSTLSHGNDVDVDIFVAVGQRGQSRLDADPAGDGDDVVLEKHGAH